MILSTAPIANSRVVRMHASLRIFYPEARSDGVRISLHSVKLPLNSRSTSDRYTASPVKANSV